MAQPCTRTYADDVTDALTLLEAAERELRNWRSHLDALLADPTPGHAYQATRSARIVAAAINEAACNTAGAINDHTKQ